MIEVERPRGWGSRDGALAPSTWRLLLLAGLAILGLGIGCAGSGARVTPPPTALAYAVPLISVPVGQTIPPYIPTVTGAVETFTVAPGLPTGLGLQPSTGAIEGTPIVPTALASYTVTAKGPSGSTATSVQIEVLPLGAPSGLSYASTTIRGTVGTPIPPDGPTVTGQVDSYSITPGLPSGLGLDPASGLLSGTPTATSALATYIVTARNSSGSASTSIQLEVLPQATPPSGLTYANPSISVTAGTAITPDQPSVTGTVTSYSVTPALPAGLTLDTSNGILSGTPTAAAALATYTVTARNAYGSTTAAIQIVVLAQGTPPSGLSYNNSSISGTVGVAITPVAPTVTGTVTSYYVSPALPAGLALSNSTGILSGTPTAAAALATYTVTARNTYGSTTATIQIVILAAVAPPPSGLSYASPSINATVGTAITPDQPTVTGTVTSYSVAPTLPSGLALDASTGILSGLPTAAAALATYTVTARNANGSTTATLQITVTAAPAGSSLRLLYISGIVPTSVDVLAKRSLIEQSPFDGLVFALRAGRLVFQTSSYSDSALATDTTNLPKINSTRLTDNFLLMRGGVDSAFDPFSDAHWAIALANVQTFAKMSKLGNLKGIAFDPEAYTNLGQKSLFDYSAYDSSSHSFQDCQTNLRARGQQFITAVQTAHPGSTFFLFGGLSNLRDGTTQFFPASSLPNRPYGLLPAFINGMLDVLASGMTLVDGDEASYTFYRSTWYTNLKTLTLSTALTFIDSANRARYTSQVQQGMSIFLDASFNQTGDPSNLAYWLADSDRANFFNYQAFWALTNTNRYLWVYSETTDWVNRTAIPAGAEAALLDAKTRVTGSLPLANNMDPIIQAAAARGGLDW